MNDITPETISCYADGELSPKERTEVEQALRDDPLLAAELDEMEDLAAYFGHIEPEAVPEELTDRLYAIDTPVVAAFETVEPHVRPTPRTWLSWAVPLAAAVLVAIGALTMFQRPEVELREFARLGVNANTGKLEELKTFASVKRRAGDRVRAAAGERITFRFGDGSEVVLLPKTEIQLRDPSEGTLFSLSEGTVLCTMLENGREREVDAGGFPIRADGAIFGVRCEPARVKTAGPSFGGSSARITVAVGRGSLEVADNGGREHLNAGERVVMQRGHETEHTPAHIDPIFAGLYEAFPHLGRRIMDGYYESSGVTRIYRRRFIPENGRLTLVVSDASEAV
ncbi:MAG: FecR domain-containing protein, partial [Planctomycetota bacterium]